MHLCCVCIKVISSHVTWIQRIIRHSLHHIWLCIVHAIFLLLFWQEFESHDGGLSQDKWVFYFNDKAEKERFLKALSDIWIKFFQVQWTYIHEYKGQILSCSAHVQSLILSPMNKKVEYTKTVSETLTQHSINYMPQILEQDPLLIVICIKKLPSVQQFRDFIHEY